MDSLRLLGVGPIPGRGKGISAKSVVDEVAQGVLVFFSGLQLPSMGW